MGNAFEGFRAVLVEGGDGEGFVVEVSLVLVSDFKYHGEEAVRATG